MGINNSFSVDNDGMQSATSRLRSAGDAIDGNHHILANRGSYGRPALSAVTGDFAGRWTQAIPGLSQMLLACGDDVEGARRTYEGADLNVCMDMRDLERRQ